MHNSENSERKKNQITANAPQLKGGDASIASPPFELSLSDVAGLGIMMGGSPSYQPVRRRPE